MSEEKKESTSEKTTFYRVKKGLSFFGIEISRQTKHPVHLTKVFFIWILAGIGLSFVASLGVYQYSTQPTFCNSCHIMEPYYNAWITSKHKGKAGCVDCHYPPPKTPFEHLWHKFQASAQVVKYVTRTYSSKPFADIVDASCLRSGCHTNRLLEGRLMTPRGVKFDHRPHLQETRRGRQLRCVSCHSQIVVGQHIEVTYDTCFLCHFRETGEGQERKPSVNCLGCHELPTKDFKLANMSYNHKDFVTERGIDCMNCHSEVVRGEGKARQDRCFNCHNQPEKLAKYNDIPFIHENHVTKHHVACLHCHEEMPHGRNPGEGGVSTTIPSETQPAESQPSAESRPSAEAARAPSVTFDCKTCHESKHMAQLEMYTGNVSSLGLQNMPSPMLLANVDCIGCHYQEERSGKEATQFSEKTLAPSEESCVKCHGPKFKGIMEETHVELKEGLDELEKKMTAARTAFDAAPTLSESDKTDLKSKLARAKMLYQFVRAGRGEHNIYLASYVMREADKLMTEVGKKTGATLPDTSGQPLISGTYCATMCHTKLEIKYPPEMVKVSFSGKMMPHLMHTTLKACRDCHSGAGSHKTMLLRDNVRKEICAGCHPE